MKAVSIGFLFILYCSAELAAQAPYYQGKSIRIVVGYPAGSAHDQWARLIAPQLTKHIPGNPSTVVQVMPGAGSMTATNYIYGVAKPDGLTLGVNNAALYFEQLLKKPEAKFDWSKFSWVGSTTRTSPLLYMWANAPYKTIHDVRNATVPPKCGVTGTGNTGYYLPKLLEQAIGTKFQLVTGYQGGADIELAVERGEVQCRAFTIQVFVGREPFHTVYLSGLIRDPEGQKMSKTRGNVVDPLAVIDETGADALRFALIHGAAAGQDQRFGRTKLENARNFANKLWNATRFVVGARPSTIAEDAERRLPAPDDLGPAERWILSRASATVEAVDGAMADFAFGEVTRVLYDAIWNEFCDWGVELAKVRLADESLPQATREATWWALVEALDTYLRLLHPVMPFVTEELWGALPHRASDPPLLIVARWPAPTGRDERRYKVTEGVLLPS